MKLEDDLARQLEQLADRIDAVPVPIHRIRRAGRRRRLIRWVGTSVAAAMLATAVAIPLTTLSGIGDRRSRNGRPASSRQERLTFMVQQGRDFRIAAMSPDGTGLTTLGMPLPSVSDPAWSPDGTRVAFSGGELARTEPVDIYVADADGSNPVRLTFDPEIPDSQPEWSPDGSRVVFSRVEGGHSSLFIVDVSTAELTRLTRNDFGADQDPAWSPDGSTIAFSRNIDTIPSIYAITPDGSGLTRLTGPRPGADTAPDWSPNGDVIAFSRTTDQNDRAHDVYVMRSDGTGLMRLTGHEAEDLAPAWSPDGRMIAFLSNRDHPNELLADLPEDELPSTGRYDVRAMEIYLMRSDGSDETRVTTLARAGYSPLGFALNWGSA